MPNNKWEKLQDFQNENKKLFIVIADPKTDEISISFGGNNAFVRFPMEDMSKGVVFNALRKSKFEQAIDAFMTGIIESTDIKEKDEGGELLKVIGGGVKALGIETKKSNELQVINKNHGKKNGK